jgi:acetyl-CoA carboxylase biotin carboxylase subunit
MFRRVLIANRGEIARRIIRACHTVGAEAVAVFSEADREGPWLREADHTICIGPGPSSQSYLDAEAVLQAAVQMECQALHPGFGFLSENAVFAQRCLSQSVMFVGPTPSAIRCMGDKATARETMRAAGLPVMPGGQGVLRSVDEARAAALEVGYPVLLKATAGGGGRGMRRVDDPERLEALYREASAEALKAFGNPDLYIEKFIVGGRHIEFQVLADHWGHVIHLGERECSVQRNHQKLIEEAPASRFDPVVREELGERIRDAVRAIGYRNAGTIEFLMDAFGHLYFMEMNTRIQVEHPVTEMVTGVDLVAWQLRIAAGQRLTIQQHDVRWDGHAIEVRINAEDPTAGFRPAPGRLERFVPPPLGAETGLRLDTCAEEGYRIPIFYDSMIGKLIAHGSTRAEALARLADGIDAFEIEGVPTTLGLHREILADETFAAGEYTCRFLEERPVLERLRAGTTPN